MNEHVNRGCTNHGCVYHYVYPELAKGMHTNGPCHCKARPVADYLYRQNAQLKAELVKAVDERDELQKLYDAGKAVWDPVYKIVLDERDRLKAKLAGMEEGRAGMSEDTTEDIISELLSEILQEARRRQAENAQLKAELAQATQREARLVSLLKRSRDVLQWDGAAYTILQEDIAEELTEEAGT